MMLGNGDQYQNDHATDGCTDLRGGTVSLTM